MAKFISRLFRSSSASKSSSFAGGGSQTSLHDNRNRQASNVRTSTSLENLASYHVVPKELEKNKLHKASWEGNLNKVSRLARPGQINLKDQHMRTPLHLAVVRGHLDVVKYLVKEGAKLDVVDNEQRTPLIKAVLSGHQNPNLNNQICQVLLDGGAGSYINEVDKQGRNALHYAIDFGTERLVNILLSDEHCDPNVQDRDQMTPLHLAIKRNSPEIVQLLVSDERELQADPNIVNRYGQTPLHTAASVGYVEIVRLLLVSNLDEPCDPSILDSQQLTAYQLAKANHQEVCAKLIEEYQERWYKQTPRRPTTTTAAAASIHEQVSARLTNSISMNPASNLQRNHDDTSDDSSSISLSKPLKPSPRRMKQSSDDWSDDNHPTKSESKPESHGLGSLLKNNPLQPAQTKINTQSTLNDLVKNNPLRTDSRKITSADKSVTSQQTQPRYFFGIGPVIERTGSDQTSTSISVDKSAIPTSRTQLNKPSTSNPYTTTVHQTVSNTRSWSDDTISVPAPPAHTKTSQLKRQDSSDDTWNSSTDHDAKNIPQPKSALSTLQKTLPFSPSTNYLTHSSSDDDSVDTEIRRSDLQQPSAGSTVQNLVNKQIGNGYKVIGLSDVQSPLSDDSSWATSPVPGDKQPTTKGIHNLVDKADESAWDDSRPLSVNLKDTKPSHSISSLLLHQPNLPETRITGVENLTAIMNTIMHSNKKQSTSPRVIGKLLISPMAQRTDSVLSENTSHEIDNDEDYEQSWRKKSEEWSVTAPHGQDFKTLQQLPRSTLLVDRHSLRDSVSSTKSSINDINELKENIKRLERKQEDTHELKRQLKEMENKKNELEKLCKENDHMLREIEIKLELEKSEKHRLESTTKDLNMELKNVKQKLLTLEDDKDLLNQRYMKLQEERDNHDKKLRLLQVNSHQSTPSSSLREDDVETMKSQHREEMKSLAADKEDLQYRTKQLQSDVQAHRESLDITKRYKIDLEQALEEKNVFQHELDRLKHEKDLVEREKLEYKTKYDGLQEEIRLILFDRSKLEQNLTGELKEHIQEKQRSADDIKKYRTQIEQLNMTLGDAEARLLVLQTQNEALLASKDRSIKDEFQSLSQRLNKTESDKTDAEQRYQHQHRELTNKQQHAPNESVSLLTSTPLTRGTQHQHLPSSACTKCNTLQQSYEQEREYRLQTEKDNERLRETVSRQKEYHHLNRTFPQQQKQPQHDEHYLIENSRQIRSDTERVKSELDRLRQDFDQLVTNYEPTNNLQQQTQLHSQIDTFRQFYEQEFRQRQLTMSKITAGVKPARTITYHRTSSSSLNHEHLHNGTSPCTACVNSRLLKERLETAIDTSLADQRLRTIKQTVPLPRQASALLTINTTHNGVTSSVEILRQPYDG